MDATVAAEEVATDVAAPVRPAAVRDLARGVAPAVADLARDAPAAAGPSPVAGPNRAVPASPPRDPDPAPTNLASVTPSPSPGPDRPIATAAAAGPSPRTTSHAAAAHAPDRAPSPRTTNPAADPVRPTRALAPGEAPAADLEVALVEALVVALGTGRARRLTNGTENPGRHRPKTTTIRPSATKAWTTKRRVVELAAATF